MRHCPPIVIHSVAALTQTAHTLANQHIHAKKNKTAVPAHRKISIARIMHPQHFHCLCRYCILLHTRRNTPPSSSSVSPCLTIQSEAGGDFLGVVAEPIVARLLPHCIPLPHLYTLPHTPSRPAALLLLPLLINYSGFCQDTCMRAHTDPHIRTYSAHTETEKSADAEGRAVGA